LQNNKKIVRINSRSPEKKLLLKACKIIKKNGVIIFPTKCLYGIGVDAFNQKAVNKVFKIKQRDKNNPILVLINKKQDLKILVKEIPFQAKVLMDKFWPGDVTIIFKAKHDIPEQLIAKTGKIGVRIPQHPVAYTLVKMAGTPITGTSANISGMKGCSDIKELELKLISNIDMVLDGGKLKGGKGSTVVDVTVSPFKILRQGSVIINNDILNFSSLKNPNL